MTSRPQATSRMTSIDSNQNTQMAGKQMLADPSKGIAHMRTRNALGDIGNRLTQKGGAGTNAMDKRGPLLGKSTAAGIGGKAVSSSISINQHPISRGIQLTRTNSMQVGGNTNVFGRHFLDKGKALARSHSSVVRSRQANAPVTLVKIEEGFIDSKVEVAVRNNVTARTATTVEKSQTVVVTEEVLDYDIDSLSSAFSLQRFGEVQIEDIDEADVGEFMLKEYAKDIDNYMHHLEKRYPIEEDFLKDRSINSRMRAVLLDWIVDVHNQFGLCQETLYLAGKTLDRYLQLDKTISRNQLQLAGVTALFIAVKFEEVCVPTIVDFSSVSDNAFKPEDVRNMEGKMLKALKFDLASPLPVAFLRRCSKALKMNVDSYVLSKLIVELSILEYSLSHIYPSMISAASIALAIMVLNKIPIQSAWTDSVVYYCRYNLAQLKPVIKVLINTLSRPYEEKDNSKFNASLNKFARSKLMRISKLPELKAVSWKVRVLAEVAKL